MIDVLCFCGHGPREIRRMSCWSFRVFSCISSLLRLEVFTDIIKGDDINVCCSELDIPPAMLSLL